MGKPLADLIDKNAKACDSIKSPSILNSSIATTSHFNLFFIFSNINLFFLPPPDNINFILLSLCIFVSFFNLQHIFSAVYSVIVAAPSSKERPLTKPRSKSFISNDF